MAGSDSPTTVASYAQAFVRALNAAGVNPHEVFEAAGVPLRVTTDPFQRLHNEQVARLFQAAIRATGDPCFGLAVGERLEPTNLHALGFGILASATLRDFYERISNYYRIVSQNAVFRHRDEDSACIMTASNMVPGVCHETVDAWVAMMVKFVRSLSQDEVNPLWIEFARPAPPLGDTPYVDYFRCPVRFDCEATSIALDRAVMDRELPGASPDLAQQNDQVAREYLEKMDRGDIVNRVRRLIVEDLSSGRLNKQTVAGRLAMSGRNLQLKLAASGTTFHDILDSTRQNLALGYIQQSHLAITEIAYLLGFSDASNFTRAFRRWNGCSPRDYRLSHGIVDA